MKRLTSIFLAMVMTAMVFSGISVSAAGNSRDDATPISIGTEISDTFTTPTSYSYYNWHKFTTTANNSFFRIRVSNLSSTKNISVQLYDANGNDLGSRMYMYVDAGKIASFDAKLLKNSTYYIRLRGDLDTEYKLITTEIKDDAPDTTAAAASLSLNRTYRMALNAERDIDAFKFTTTGNNSFYRVSINNINLSSYLSVDLIDKDGKKVTGAYLSTSGGKTTMKEFKLSAKTTYYLIFGDEYNKNMGSYSFSINERKDDVGDTFAQSKGIALNKKHSYALNALIDKDYFKFVSTGGSYTFEITNINIRRVRMEVLDENKKQVTLLLADSASLAFDTEKLIKGKTYYIEMSSYDSSEGKYDFIVRKSDKPIITKISGLKVKKSSSKSIKVSWKKLNFVSGYEIYCSTSKKGKYKKVKTVGMNTTSFNHKKLKKGKTYYYKVKAFKKYYYLTYLSKFSGIKALKLK